jgi:AcrR family transcriptional regulator
MTPAGAAPVPAPWAERAADRSPVVHRSRARSIEQARSMVDAARRLIAQKGERFTTQELVKEAGVALQTFYRHFEGKDQLLLAVMEDMIAEGAARFEEAAKQVRGPLERLHFYIRAALESLSGDDDVSPRFTTAEHWRLYQLFPTEMEYATKPVTDLFLREIRDAEAQGLVHPVDAPRAAWLMTKLTMAAFHHYAFAVDDAGAATIADDVWAFCVAALGGQPPPTGAPRRRRAAAAAPAVPQTRTPLH